MNRIVCIPAASPLGDRRARVLLCALASAAGCTDAVTYTQLGQVFTANMTGNTVLLGIAVIAGDAARVARSACALAGFCLGVALAARSIGDERVGIWPRRASLALASEAALLAVLAIAATVLGTSAAHVYGLVALSGVAMGVQSAAVRAIAVPGVATTYITGTLTGMIAGAVESADQDPRAQTGRVAAAIWVFYLAAALAGAAAASAIGLQAIWIAVVIVTTVSGVAFLSFRPVIEKPSAAHRP